MSPGRGVFFFVPSCGGCPHYANEPGPSLPLQAATATTQQRPFHLHSLPPLLLRVRRWPWRLINPRPFFLLLEDPPTTERKPEPQTPSTVNAKDEHTAKCLKYEMDKDKMEEEETPAAEGDIKRQHTLAFGVCVHNE